MKILVSYRGIPQSPGWATGDMVVKAFRELGHEAYSYAKYYQENRWVDGRPGLDDHDWDLIVFMECNDGDPQYSELRITRTRKIVGWFFDTSYHTNRYKPIVDYFEFDHIFLANPLTIQEYKVWGYDNVSYLPYACDSELHVRSLSYPKTRDVVLVGSIRDDRKKLAEDLKKQGVNLELIGGVFREEYIDTLASARLVINQNPMEGNGLLNMRHFETPAAGTFLIEQRRDLEVNIKAELPYPWYCFPALEEEIADFCNDFLKENGALEEDVHREFLETQTYKNRCKQILEKVFSGKY